MQTLKQNLNVRVRNIISHIKANSDPADYITGLSDDVKSVHIVGGIVVYSYPADQSRLEKPIFQLGFKSHGNLYPVIGVGFTDITTVSDNWERAKNLVEAAEQKLGLASGVSLEPKAKVA